MGPDHHELARLCDAQAAALQFVRDLVTSRHAQARDRVTTIVRDAGCAQGSLEAAAETIRTHARVVLHFHPDRIGVDGVTVAEALLEGGQYRNQFETGLSTGSRTAFPGGDRDTWERNLFGGAYHTPGASPADRPKYGALELIRHPDGPWPRFGSCYFLLRTAVSHRTSFTFSGSEQPRASERLGTIDRMHPVLAPLLADVAGGQGAIVPWPPFVAPILGVEKLTVAGLLDCITRELPSPLPVPSTRPAGRTLDSGIEAQVHGPVDLARDVEMLVADPAFSATPTGDLLQALSQRYRFPLHWHCGFRMPARDVPDDFRGPSMPTLARRIAGEGMLDAAVIGAAEASLRVSPETWRDWGPFEDTLQQLKQLWHVLVHYGATVATNITKG